MSRSSIETPDLLSGQRFRISINSDASQADSHPRQAASSTSQDPTYYSQAPAYYNEVAMTPN